MLRMQLAARGVDFGTGPDADHHRVPMAILAHSWPSPVIGGPISPAIGLHLRRTMAAGGLFVLQIPRTKKGETLPNPVKSAGQFTVSLSMRLTTIYEHPD